MNLDDGELGLAIATGDGLPLCGDGDGRASPRCSRMHAVLL